METSSKKIKLAPVVLRLGLAAVFLWFGFTQLRNPDGWTKIVPDLATTISGMSPTAVVLFNGWFEVLTGAFLAFGFLTRWAALVLFLHLLLITASIGLNAIGVRDFGLTLATLALFLFGEDDYTADACLSSRFPRKGKEGA